MRKSRNDRRTKSLSPIIVFVGCIALILYLGSANLVGGIATEDSATDASIPQEQIKENLKDRLEKAAKDNQPLQLKRAWVGTLDSIANHTLTIETREGPRLASVSAETTFVRMPKRETIKLADLELGSYTVAMGHLNGNQVLAALRIIVEKEVPPPADRLPHFIKILKFDTKKDLLTGELPTQETLTALLTKDTILTTAEGGAVKKASTDDLVEGRRAVAIVKTESAKGQSPTLVNIHLLAPQGGEESLQEEPEASTPSERPRELPDTSPSPTE